MMDGMMVNPVLAEVVRSGFTESWHRGSFVALDASGNVAFSAGSAAIPVFPRSSNKPLQAVAMLRARLDLDGELLALASASHSGEDFHVAGVQRILENAGLTSGDLQCPPALPLDPDAARRAIRAGQPPARIWMNCSGKHAAMLATCAANGWPTATYRDPGHPLQRLIYDTVQELTGETITATGVDGCGAPLFALTLTGLARAFRALVLAAPGTPERRVADAIRAHPELTSGTKRDENLLMRAVPGLLDKGGAEAVDAFALPDGRAAAVKFDDGFPRARTPVTAAILRRLDIDVPDRFLSVPVLGGGEPVGEIRAAAGCFRRERVGS
jgi:L-asparaginase II